MESQKREFDWKLFGIFLIPVLIAYASAGIVVYLMAQSQVAQEIQKSKDVSQYELRRLISMVNYRLNVTREELVHIHHQLVTVNPSIPVNQKEKILFLRRDFLAGFAIFQAKPNVTEAHGADDFQLKQFWTHKGSLVPDGYAQTDQIQRVLQSSMTSAAQGGFDIRRLEQKDIVSASSSPITAMNTGTLWFILSYRAKDFNGEEAIYSGIYSSQYLFPFCRQLSSQLEKIATYSYITDQDGIIVCHANARSEGGSIHDFEYFHKMLSEPSPQDPNGVSMMSYQNPQSIEVNASFKKVNNGNLVLVSESTATKEVTTYIPQNEALATLLFSIAVTLGVVLVLSKRSTRVESAPQILEESVATEGDSTSNVTLTQELSAKYEKEIEELKATALSLQSENAYLTSFQTIATQSKTSQELIERMIRVFEETYFGKSIHVLFMRLEKDIKGEQILRAVQASKDVSPTLVAGLVVPFQEDGFEDQIAKRLPFSPLRFYPAEVHQEALGYWIFGGLEHKAQNEIEAMAYDMLPVILQSFATSYALLTSQETNS